MLVKIRFNTDYPLKSDKRWRLLHDDKEWLADEIKGEGLRFTTSEDIVLRDGIQITKFHISAEAEDMKFVEEDGKQVIRLT